MNDKTTTSQAARDAADLYWKGGRDLTEIVQSAIETVTDDLIRQLAERGARIAELKKDKERLDQLEDTIGCGGCTIHFQEGHGFSILGTPFPQAERYNVLPYPTTLRAAIDTARKKHS